MSRKILRALFEIDAALAVEGVHRMSHYWRKRCRHFYTHPTARQMAECVGRGGVKSGTSVKMAIAEVRAGTFDDPPGERHYFIHVSENVPEASKTLAVLQQYLRLLQIPFRAVGDTIELDDMPRGFRVLACRVGAVSGFRCIGWTADECAKWSNDGVDPSSEVIGSIRAMTVTHKTARSRLLSSPLAMLGFFYETWAKGDTDHQVAGQAPTWIANPGVTEEQTRELEPDERVWRREYKAEPQASVLAVFEASAVDRAIARDTELAACEPPKAGKAIMVIDASSGRKDAFTWAFAQWVQLQDGRELLRISEIDAVEGRFYQQITGTAIVQRLALHCKSHNVQDIHGDQRESMMLAEAFRPHGVRFHEQTWTSATKPEAVERVRRWLADDILVLPDHRKLRRELLEFQEKVTPSGQFTFSGRGGGHDDFVSLVVTAAMADIDGELRSVKRSHRMDIDPRDCVVPWTPLDQRSAGYENIGSSDAYASPLHSLGAAIVNQRMGFGNRGGF